MSLNPYTSLGTAVGTSTALDLAHRLSAWHDTMVMHQRRAEATRGGACEPDCPHAQAPPLWKEALEVFGDRARGLGFLRTHGEVQVKRVARRPVELSL